MPDTSELLYNVVLHHPAWSSEETTVSWVEGSEALSRLYEFDVVIQAGVGSQIDADAIDTLLTSSSQIAYLTFSGESAHNVFGRISSAEMLPVADLAYVSFRLRLEPRLSLLARSFGSTIYQSLSVDQVVTNVLQAAGFESDRDFSFQLSATHPVRDYIVQHQETDLDFVMRLLEAEGIFFFFEQKDDRERVVFADDNAAFASPDTLPYRPIGDGTLTPSVRTLRRSMETVSKDILLRDDDPMKPALNLNATAVADAAGVGRRYFHGENHATQAHGTALAKLRAQEELVRKERFGGETNVLDLHPGRKFTLEDHPVASLDQDYLVTEVHHRFAPASAADGSAEGSSQAMVYSNQFAAIKPVIAFRPARITPRPRISGFVQGWIDGPDGLGAAAPVDEQGRYRVVLSFDASSPAPGRASMWIRMMQSSAGPLYGSHHRLHVGTEVLVAHLQGDPDRPVIAGAVHNAEAVSPVALANATQSVVRTRAGVLIQFEDNG